MTDYREHRYASACGRLQLFARDYGGTGKPLLLMHGLTRNSADFEPLAEHLAGDYRLIVPDQRGRGLSDYDPDPANYRPDVYAQDMFALLDMLEIAGPGAIGTSMGGLIAMAMNAMKPETFPAIIFNDVGPELAQEGLARIGSYVGGGGAFADWGEAAKSCAAINGDAFPDFKDADWHAWARRTCRQVPDGGLEFAYDRAIASGFADIGDTPQPDLWPLWQMLGGTPVLVLRGELSDLLTSDVLSRMEDLQAGPFARVVVPQRGHAPLLDEPEALTAIMTFLREHYL
ncbi:alpha/beta fold hydrolase [Aurantiacibacter sp. D1-12]|uniref:alpha/beta fold hydrolase n=1 Tax=Aurantiacibacter sp. D1-12 TaxID=2993658 RepID=UPI00237C5417|nr:alpha/beta hydrolase [Aurantiacibacter sp. D1-12]MDE1466486.1 alpha/beta hydrolase [Aurantiacibacter sp. D1-12]